MSSPTPKQTKAVAIVGELLEIWDNSNVALKAPTPMKVHADWLPQDRPSGIDPGDHDVAQAIEKRRERQQEAIGVWGRVANNDVRAEEAAAE